MIFFKTFDEFYFQQNRCLVSTTIRHCQFECFLYWKMFNNLTFYETNSQKIVYKFDSLEIFQFRYNPYDIWYIVTS